MKGWRTLTFNVVAGALPILQMTEFQEVLPIEYLPYYTIIIAIANIYLRKITNTPIGKKL